MDLIKNPQILGMLVTMAVDEEKRVARKESQTSSRLACKKLLLVENGIKLTTWLIVIKVLLSEESYAGIWDAVRGDAPGT